MTWSCSALLRSLLCSALSFLSTILLIQSFKLPQKQKNCNYIYYLLPSTNFFYTLIPISPSLSLSLLVFQWYCRWRFTRACAFGVLQVCWEAWLCSRRRIQSSGWRRWKEIMICLMIMSSVVKWDEDEIIMSMWWRVIIVFHNVSNRLAYQHTHNTLFRKTLSHSLISPPTLLLSWTPILLPLSLPLLSFLSFLSSMFLPHLSVLSLLPSILSSQFLSLRSRYRCEGIARW